MFLLDTLRGLRCTFGGTSGAISLYWSLRRIVEIVHRELRNIPVDLYTMSRIVTSAFTYVKRGMLTITLLPNFSTCAPVSTTLTTMKTTWGFSFHPHQVYFVQRPLTQLSSLWCSPNDYCFRSRPEVEDSMNPKGAGLKTHKNSSGTYVFTWYILSNFWYGFVHPE